MKLSLRSKLSLSYIILTMISVLLISIAANMLLEKQFRNYTIQNREKINREIVELISKGYYGDGVWDTEIIENIGLQSLEKGLIIKVKDSQGVTVWDATMFNSGLCEEMLSNISRNMINRYPDWKGEYIENKFIISENYKEVGFVEIGYNGPFYYTNEDLFFIDTLNKVIIGVGTLTLIVALIFGTIMAGRISTPVSRVIGIAQSISNGSYDNRITENSNISEINQLTTAINSLAESLGKQEELRKRLTQDVAHELRTPLATLQANMEAFIDGIWKPEIYRLKSCHEEVMRINNMVGDLERLARFEGENLVLNKTEFDLSELIKAIITNYESDYLKKEIQVSYTGESGVIFADRDKITQVIINILTNAIKYTPNGGSIDIDIKSKEEEVAVTIKDNGIGISQEDLQYIFERFYRADKSRNRLTGGAGIGLTITKAIVEAHKGKINVMSEQGKGTEFTVYLPMIKSN